MCNYLYMKTEHSVHKYILISNQRLVSISSNGVKQCYKSTDNTHNITKVYCEGIYHYTDIVLYIQP